MTHTAPTFTACNAEEAALLFMSHVVKHHGLPESIITDRGTQLTGTFWEACMHMLGTKHSKTAAFHPQSDRQTERINCVLEEMLRHYVGGLLHTNWHVYLPMAEYAINNKVGFTTQRLRYAQPRY
eukprot:351314-Chlamydomonas_euryale.AAC.4